MAYPNGGRVWDGNDRGWVTLGSDRLALEAVGEWIAAGARIVGGCCGIGPASIHEIAEAYGWQPQPVSASRIAARCSGVVPQQPPIRLAPASRAARAYSAESAGVPG